MDPRAIYTLPMKVGGSTDIDLDASFNTDAQKLEMTPGFAIQFSWSGASSPVGTFQLESSNDASVWTAIEETQLAVSGASGSHMVNVERPCYLYVRVTYTRTSGSGGSVIIKINGVN